MFPRIVSRKMNENDDEIIESISIHSSLNRQRYSEGCIRKIYKTCRIAVNDYQERTNDQELTTRRTTRIYEKNGKICCALVVTSISDRLPQLSLRLSWWQYMYKRREK